MILLNPQLRRWLLLLTRLLRPLSLSSARRVLSRNGYVSHSKKSWDQLTQSVYFSEQEIRDLQERIKEREGELEESRREEEKWKESAKTWEQEFFQLKGSKMEIEKLLREQLEKTEKVTDGLSRTFLKQSFYGVADPVEVKGPMVKGHPGGYVPQSVRTKKLFNDIIRQEIRKTEERQNALSSHPVPDIED